MNLNKEDMDKLEELAKPVREFLESKCNPHCYVNIGWSRTSINESVMSIPVKEEN